MCLEGIAEESQKAQEYVLQPRSRGLAMKGKILLGVVLVVVGFIVAVGGFAGLRQPDRVRAESAAVGDQNQPYRDEATGIVVPVIAGLSLAAGAILIGLGMGGLRRPRIVGPNSPHADEAATTRPMSGPPRRDGS